MSEAIDAAGQASAKPETPVVSDQRRAGDPVGDLRALTLNLWHGGGQRSPGLLAWAIGCRANLVVLPEWRSNAVGSEIERALQQDGFATAGACRATRSTNGLLVGAREAFKHQRITPDGSNKGELLHCEFQSGLLLLAVYFPQGVAKAPFFEISLAVARAAGQHPFLMMGDFNTGRDDLDIEGRGKRFDCDDLFLALEGQAGLRDLWRMGRATQQEWSWRSRSNGFRIDHAFANPAFLERFEAISCHYDHAPRETGLSDHSALLITAGPGKARGVDRCA